MNATMSQRPSLASGLRRSGVSGTVFAPRASPLLPGLARRQPVLSIRCSAERGNFKQERDLSTKAAASVEPVSEDVVELPTRLDGISYSKQYDIIFSKRPINPFKTVPKPDKLAQAQEPGNHQVFNSDVHCVEKRPFFLNRREWNNVDLKYALFIGGMHVVALAAPFTFSWPMFWLFMGTYFLTGCFGITLSYHRQLSHRSFVTPKWLEYIFAYCGVLAVQGDPLEWASTHRYHHLHSDTPLDPHSPYEGFWWCHMGWLLDNVATLERVKNRSNCAEMEAQWYYRWLRDTYTWHVVAQFTALYLLGGFPAVVWGGALRMCWVWHITWFVNSANHCWGYQIYDSGDLSKNNWWVSMLGFGEGWHNNHHAFEFSARHGFEWWQIDITWYIISALQKMGLATNVKMVTEKQKQKLLLPQYKN